MGPSHFFSPSKETLNLKLTKHKLPEPPKSESVSNKVFFRNQTTIRFKNRSLTVRFSNEWPLGYKYSKRKFFIPKFHRNTSSFRFMWMYVSVGRT